MRNGYIPYRYKNHNELYINKIEDCISISYDFSSLNIIITNPDTINTEEYDNFISRGLFSSITINKNISEVTLDSDTEDIIDTNRSIEYRYLDGVVIFSDIQNVIRDYLNNNKKNTTQTWIIPNGICRINIFK